VSKPIKGYKPALLVLLGVLLYAEAVAMAGVSAYLLVELLTARPDSYASAVAILLLALIAAVFLFVLATHTLRGRPWIRGATVTWQVLQILIGVVSLQGPFARPDIASALIIPAAVVLVLLFTPSVLAATRREPEL
jgi:hypothetical protein